jgi:integrase
MLTKAQVIDRLEQYLRLRGRDFTTVRAYAMVRWHIPDWTVQQAVASACDTLERAGRIHARITPHCLRHWYGTHFQGDIRDLQAMLGHKSLETTQTYRHPHLDRVRSPILELLSPAA